MIDPKHTEAEIALDTAVERVHRRLEVEIENESAAQLEAHVSAVERADADLKRIERKMGWNTPPGAEGSW